MTDIAEGIKMEHLIKRGSYNPTATVGELVAALQQMDQNAPVLTEGCDCYGNVVKVSVFGDGFVVIERDDYIDYA